MTRTSSVERMSRNRRRPRTADARRAPQVTSCEPRSPIARPKKPAITVARSGRKTTAAANVPTPGSVIAELSPSTRASSSALHHVDVFDPDGAAVAEVDNEDGETDSRLRRRNGQHKHREDLADEVVKKHGESDKVNADRKQHQLDRHQHDDHILAVQKDTEDSEREEYGGDRQVMGKTYRHQPPLPIGTLMISTDWARVRASCAEIDCRRTSARWRKVSTIAPTIATSRIRPAA